MSGAVEAPKENRRSEVHHNERILAKRMQSIPVTFSTDSPCNLFQQTVKVGPSSRRGAGGVRCERRRRRRVKLGVQDDDSSCERPTSSEESLPVGYRRHAEGWGLRMIVL
eukprot:753421-Hanusia_phi.AAC.2